MERDLAFSQISDGLSAAIATTTGDGRVDLANRQFLDYLGMSLEELENWQTSGAVHPDDLPTPLERVRPCCSYSGQGYLGTPPLRPGDGNPNAMSDVSFTRHVSGRRGPHAGLRLRPGGHRLGLRWRSPDRGTPRSAVRGSRKRSDRVMRVRGTGSMFGRRIPGLRPGLTGSGITTQVSKTRVNKRRANP
jgi:PAS domain-containing protein